MRGHRIGKPLGALAAFLLAASGAMAQEAGPPVKLGIVTFLSGAAAGPFGVPARNAAELVIEVSRFSFQSPTTSTR